MNQVAMKAIGRRAKRDARRRQVTVEALEGRIVMASNAQLSVGPLINISRIAGNETEPAIAIDPSNPQRLFAGAIGGPAAGGQVGSLSTNSGASWQSRVMSDGSDGTPVACCDATLSFDSFGNLFFGYIDLDNLTGVVLLSTDGGVTFSQIADLGGMDQPTVITGPGNAPGTQSVWVTYNRNGQIFARGALITGPGQVGAFQAEQATGETGNYGDVMVGPNGEVFVAYQENAGGEGPTFVSGNFDPDGLGPAGFGAKVQISSTNVGGFDYIAPQPDRSVDAEVGLAWDTSNGVHRGRLYAMYTDETPNESDDTDIMLRYSDDNGATWSAALRVNDDTTTRSQFLPKIALDSTTGTIAITWLDSRLDDGSNPAGDTDGRANTEAILFATVSTDGGQTVIPNVQIGRGPSNQATVAPPVSGFADIDYGDYLGLAFHAGKFYPIWPDNSAQMPGIIDRPNFDLATAEVSVIQLQVSPTPITGLQEDTPFSGEVARFDSFNPSDQPSDFTATIEWGDGGSTAGVITRISGSLFQVTGSHTYQDGGSYPILVTVAQNGGGTASVTNNVQVANLPLTGESVTITQQNGQPLQEGDTFSGVVARFTDTDLGTTTPDLYTATITWEDDGSSSIGTIQSLGGNTYQVVSDHVVGGGTASLTVQIVGPGGVTVTVVSTTIATDSPMDSAGLTFSPIEGTPYPNLPIAFFVDADPRTPPASSYTASINWGDGTALETGAIRTGTGEINGQTLQGFYVYSAGSHVYDARPTPYQVTVSIGNLPYGPGTSTTQAISQATVIDAPILAEPLSYALQGSQFFTNFLATFVDTDPRPHTVDRYAATIDWGDGSASEAVEVRINTDGGYLVYGQHGFRLSGVFSYSLTIQDIVGGGPGTTVEGTIEVPPSTLNIVIVTEASPVEGETFNDVIATFTSSNPSTLPADFTAAITWGDGTTTPNATIVERVAEPGVFDVLGGDKTYILAGNYPVSVVVTGDNNEVQASGNIQVTDAPFTANGMNLPAPGQPALQTKTDFFGLLVATFQDTGPVSSASEFTATITWGDGSTSAGTIVQTGFQQYEVRGDHQFSRPGTLATSVSINSQFGQSETATGVAVVEAKLTTLTGSLAPASGPAASVGVTQLNQPVFQGTAEPGATVSLYVIPAGQSDASLVATALADASGVWTATTQSLGEGMYTVVGAANDALGFPSSSPIQLLPAAGPGPLIIDQTGPRANQVAVNTRTGRINVTLTDDGSGLLRSALADPSNYQLSVVGRRVNRALPLVGIDLSAAQPNTVQTATLTFSGLGRLNSGTYVFQMSTPGLTDVAGNALDERFYVPFPGLYKPGQNFVAQFSVDGGVASPLRQYVPPPEVTAARRYQERINRLRLTRRSR